jgi:hypothetical protein
LIDWWFATSDTVFSDSAMLLARKPVDGLDSSYDGEECVAVIGKLRDRDYYGEMPGADQMADLLEEHFVEMVETAMPSDELEKISDAVEEWGQSLRRPALDAVDAAIRNEFEDVNESISDINSESTLDDHATTLQKLAKRTGVPAATVKRAIECVQERKAWLEEQALESESPTVKTDPFGTGDKFDDAELRDLFSPLLQRDAGSP